MDPQLNIHVEGLGMDSSQVETYHDHDSDHLLPPKLRLMCSYGGHIMPRPHDKALSYVGGETRLVVVDRKSSLSSFSSRLSRTLLNGRPFTLKYQLPSEDLDSLVSITTDEDLHNMVEEYDRIITPAPTLSVAANAMRIRLFIFFTKIETAATMGSLLDDAKSETWFVDALNGSGLIPRGLSDSVTVNNCLVNLDMDAAAEDIEHEEKQAGSDKSNATIVENGVEDEQQLKMEEQFSRMNFMPTTMPNKLVGFRKPPLPLHPLQIKSCVASVATNSTYSLASPDSVASDTSISSGNSFSNPMYYQDQVQVPSADNINTNINPSNTHIQIHKLQDSGYILPDQQQPQMSMHYIPHPAAVGAASLVSPYYHTYPLQQQEQQQQQHHHYPHLYAMQQPSYMPMQSEAAENSAPKLVSKPVEVMGGGVYRTVTPPQYVQVSHNQLQPQPHYIQGFGQYQNPIHEHQLYYTPQMLPSQYQTMTPTAAVAALADATNQLSPDATL